MKKLSLVCLGFLVLGLGCGKSRVEMAAWSKPAEIAKSSDSLDTSFSLYKWNGSLLALGGDAGTFVTRVLEDDGEKWRTVSTVDPGWIPMDVDTKENRFVVARATLLRDRVDANFSIGLLSPDGRFASTSSVAILMGKTQLFPNSPPNLEINENEKPGHVGFAGGVMEETEIRVPYSISGVLIERKGHQVGISGDTSANGVFASSDGGKTWRNEPILIAYSDAPLVCRTRGYYYYFVKGQATPSELWFSRCSVGESAWSNPETLNKSVAHQPVEHLHAIGEDDTVHICWLDARNEKTRFSLSRPRAENYEVAYCNRKDSDSKWSKDVILSKGHRWSYAPSMSVESTNFVVAWAGANGSADRTEYGPSDIYYVTSKDSGKTWTKPIQVTDGFKSGITSGRPQVALHKGVIHLFYIQGTLNYQKVSAGMVKLNQPPWPILYQQRPFPN